MDEEEIHLIFRTVEGGDVEEVARLLDAEPHLMEALNPDDDQTPLIMAAERGHVGMVRLLLERGADVNAGSLSGDTALHEAAARGHEEVVSILLGCGADHSRMDVILGGTPLIFASRHGHLGVARQLLQVGECGLDEGDDDGCTALWWACARGHAEVARALLLAGADHTIADDSGQTPRQIAEERGRTGCLALLQVSSECIILRAC
jgi:ankyrin repeat protein